ARADAPLRPRPLAAPVGSLLVREPVDGSRARLARGRPGDALAPRRLADPVRDCAADPRPSLACGPLAAGGGACRSEDGALQRPLLRSDAARGARARDQVRPADVARDG